jgi:hypothetical protein
MPLNLSQYVDPGVYVTEVVIPGNVSALTVPLTVCLVGAGNRDKRAQNEAIQHGLVELEALALSSTPGAHDDTLANICNRNTSQATLFRDAVEVDGSYWSFLQATISEDLGGTLNMATTNTISLALDGKVGVSIKLANGANSVAVSGTNILVTNTGFTMAAITAANLVTAINLGLGDSGATALGYGPSYAAVASNVTTTLTVTSPNTTSLSDIRLYASLPASASATALVFGVSMPHQVPTSVRLDNAEYSGSSAYTMTYVATNVEEDTLANADVQSVIRVGAYAGMTSYVEDDDYALAGDQLDWDLDAAAAFTSSVASATFDVSTNDVLILALDGKAAVTIDLNGLGSPPLGYANPSSPAAATGAELVANINAVLAASATYGAKYNAVATFAATKITLTSPTTGYSSVVEIAAPTSLSAVTALLGLGSSQLPYDTRGTGKSPIPGAVYFATYEFTRDSGEYNVIKRFFTKDALFADLGTLESTNPLAIAGDIAFTNQAPSVSVVQCNDLNYPGSPTTSEMNAAIDAAGNSSVPTEIIPLDVRLVVQAHAVQHVVDQNSITIKNYRRGWFGMEEGTEIGDKDTPDTFVYRARRTFQVPGDSPGRGRLILVAPDFADRVLSKEDGSEQTVTLNGPYIATAIAALMSSFSSPSDTLMRKQIRGFEIDTFPTYLKTERALLASSGVTVVTLDAGRLMMLDPLTTEAGGGHVVTFQEISASTQKDSVTTTVQEVVEANLVGIVPSDTDVFMAAVKGYIGGALRSLIASGAIGPFKTDAGVTRDIDFASDIQVTQDQSDVTKYYFKFFFNLRLPAKRFFGEFAVNSNGLF